MKRSLIAVLLLVALAMPAAVAGAQAPDPDVLAVAEADAALALKLHRQLGRRPGNLLFSPYSIASALAMAYAGAHGTTAEQMARVLGFTLDQARLHPAVAGLSRQMAAAASGPGQQLSIANALWLQKGSRLEPGFIALVNQNYGASLARVDFTRPAAAAAAINKWVDKHTDGMIPELVNSGDVEGAQLVLTNAIYFQGKWVKPFDKKNTRPQTFWLEPKKGKPVPTMHCTGRFDYGQDAVCQVLALPYRGRALEMVIILPRRRDGLAALEAGLNSAWLKAKLAAMTRQKVMVSLPRLKLKTAYRLSHALQALGMVDAFSSRRADFSGITGGRDFYIGQVVHKARLELEETGTRAAAATAVVMRSVAMAKPEPPKIFNADHPFVFLIRHRPSGAILFMGRVVEPG